MTYTLIFCSALNIFALTDPFGGHRTLTESQLMDSIGDNDVLRQWVGFVKSHPDTRVNYSMLPS